MFSFFLRCPLIKLILVFFRQVLVKRLTLGSLFYLDSVQTVFSKTLLWNFRKFGTPFHRKRKKIEWWECTKRTTIVQKSFDGWHQGRDREHLVFILCKKLKKKKSFEDLKLQGTIFPCQYYLPEWCESLLFFHWSDTGDYKIFVFIHNQRKDFESLKKGFSKNKKNCDMWKSN